VVVNPDFQFQSEITVEPDGNTLSGLILPNGLQVVMIKKSETPIVAVDIWYKVGSRDEKPGKSGFAHLFEHMMFQGSENVGKAEHMKLINDVGGMVNGSTSQDRTNYFQVVPANQLELALWLEADRMRSLSVNLENFENQRSTVKEERRLRIDNQPYMRVLYELKDEVAYTNFAYKHSVIGSMEDLDRASLQDVKDFHDLYYRPNNAVLSVVGDFSVVETTGLLQKHFGDIPSGRPVPGIDLTEPDSRRKNRYNYRDPFAPFPALMVFYLIPERTHPDFYALELLEKILFDGESSRFYSSLVEDQQLALHMFGGNDGKFGPALFFIFAQLHPGKDLGELEKSIQKEFQSVCNNEVSSSELEKAKNKVKADFISQQETVRSMADLLCFYATLYENPAKLFRELHSFEQITIDDLQQAAARYFLPENRSVIEIYPSNI
jgi:zinc protease